MSPRAFENNSLCKIWGGGGGQTKCIMGNSKIEKGEGGHGTISVTRANPVLFSKSWRTFSCHLIVTFFLRSRRYSLIRQQDSRSMVFIKEDNNELKHARFWDADGNWKWAVFPFKLSSHKYTYIATAGLICRSQVAGRRSRVAGDCFTNTESILNIHKS